MLHNTLSMKGKIMFKKFTALVATLALTFVGLTSITGPIQQANAFTSPLCGPAYDSTGPVIGTSVDNLSAGDKVCVRSIAEAGVKFKSLGSCVTVGQGVKPVPAKPVKPKPVLAKAKKAKGSITFIWGASGFLTTIEIYYRVKETSKWKIVRVSSADRKKIKLKRKKTYQFQLRSYKSVNGKNYYSAWTKKTVKS
jgi:hypothetical protein